MEGCLHHGLAGLAGLAGLVGSAGLAGIKKLLGGAHKNESNWKRKETADSIPKLLFI